VKNHKPPPQRRTRWRRILFAALLVLAAPVVLFVFNSLCLSYGETPHTGVTGHAAADGDPVVVKVLSYNIAKGFAHEGGLSLHFDSADAVRGRLDQIAALINAERPDLVFLSETLIECGPCPVNQVTYLADATGMHSWAFGEHFNLGVPFYRVVGGNAILARRPLEPVANPSLSGWQQCFVTSNNNRRALWCSVRLGGRRVLLASVHNDSYSLANNRAQVRQILDFAGDRDAVLAGDFNARPDDPPIELIRASGRYQGAGGPPTFPAEKPDRRIDFILAPKDWELLDERVLPGGPSDHRAVVATFRVQRAREKEKE
jgi:endonuclease/exonuclease/phosphatase family metal-dependent hydrolase